jgi:hypothetical protein
MHIDAELIALIEQATAEAGGFDYLTRLQRVVSAVVNAYPEVTASEALATVQEVWSRRHPDIKPRPRPRSDIETRADARSTSPECPQMTHIGRRLTAPVFASGCFRYASMPGSGNELLNTSIVAKPGAR